MPSHDFFRFFNILSRRLAIAPKPGLKYRLCQRHQRRPRRVMLTFWIPHQASIGLMEILNKVLNDRHIQKEPSRL
ncbi:hypothetical protein WG66_005689 [Moniliophthora roreri]|nr:hypothetical protein WG66_005689 [Moniliophthora roreri]